MSASENTLNQRIVYSGLRRMTTDRNTIQSAYNHWQTTLGGKPFNVVEVVDAINAFLGLDTGERKRLMIALHAASGKLAEELEEVPGYMQADSLGSSNQGAETAPEANQIVRQGSPHAQATKMFCNTFVKHVERANAADFRDFTQACTEIEYSDNKKVQSAMLDFAKSSFAKLALPSNVTEQECADVASALHLLSTEFVGPMVADQLQSKTIDGLLTMDFATQFDPRKLV